MRTGDAIASVATPIARALGLPCIDPETKQLRPESGCAKMRGNLNTGTSIKDAIFQRWFKAKQEGEKMKYQVSVVIEAEKLTEAAQKAEAIGDVLSIQARPEPQARPQLAGQQQHIFSKQ